MKNVQKSKNILIVDDETNWLNFAQHIITNAGYNTYVENNIVDSLVIAKKKLFELILIDYKIVEQKKVVFQKLSHLQRGKNRYVVVMFPMEITSTTAGEIFKLGANDCVDKPYEPSKLLKILEKDFTTKDTLNFSDQKHGGSKPPNILIVEDDKDWQDRLARYLKTENYQVDIASNNSIALKLLKSKNFDLVILDLRLIDNSDNFEGMDLLELFRSKGYKMQVIIVSAYDARKTCKRRI